MNKPVFLTPDPNFDWDGYAKDASISASEKHQEEVALYEETLRNVNENEVVTGRIIDILPNTKSPREFIVDIGSKAPGEIPAAEFRYNPDFKVGDVVEVFVRRKENQDGHPELSHREARLAKAWERIAEAAEKDEIVIGYIKSRTKGGMVVDVFGVDAFLPGSQIDVRPIRDYDALVDKTMEFKIVKLNQEQRNVVVSHKVLIEAELEQRKRELIGQLERGQVLEGVVKNILPFGVFVDLGGIDGLIHITDLSWKRIASPEDVVAVDQQINVVILDFDEERTRISLGLKQLTPNPWDTIGETIEEGSKIKGRVEVVMDYGAFVEVVPGVEGLIHVSEMSWTQHLRSAQDFLKVGDEVEAVVLSLDPQERKLSLGMKQLRPDPWTDIELRYPVGTQHTAKVRNFTNYGVFVELEEGVDGLIHVSDLSWTKRIKHPSEFTEVGKDIEVMVLEIDTENRRLSLGHKQTEENPWDEFETLFTEGSIHEATVLSGGDSKRNISVMLPYGVTAYSTPRHLTKENGQRLVEGEKADFKIIEFNRESQRIFVSHARVWEDEKRIEEDLASQDKEREQQAISQKVASQKVEKATLGDLAAFADLADALEDGGAKATKQEATTEEEA